MASKAETILLGVRNDNVVKIALPPRDRMDDFNARALECGRIIDVRHILCSPDGELYCVRGSDLYAGQLPTSKTSDWFSQAKRVGRQEWGNFKLLCFHPKGDLYAVTHEGKLYKGPKPVNENRPWLYGEASNLANEGWQTLEAMFFDPQGSLYTVSRLGFFFKGLPPDNTHSWSSNSKLIGKNNWNQYTHYMSITPDGKLWCVDKNNGDIYRGDPPTSERSDYFKSAEHLGRAYQVFKMCFTQDKTIHNIISFKFLPEKGKKLSENLEVITTKFYDNLNSTSPLKHNFKFEKCLTETSCFTHEHGFSIEVGAETTVKGGMPFVAEAETTIKVNASTTHNWQFTETNEKQITVSLSEDVEIAPGKAVKVKALMMTAQINCPYEAEVETLFGNRTCIKGNWKGSSHYNLHVKQEDYNG